MEVQSREISPVSHTFRKPSVISTPDATYNSPPHPRPLKLNYDTLPAPRLVSPNNSPSAPSGASSDSSVSLTPPPAMTPPNSSAFVPPTQLTEEENSSSCNEEGLHISQQSLPSLPSELSKPEFAFRPKSHSVKEVESYLDMNVTNKQGKYGMIKIIYFWS